MYRMRCWTPLKISLTVPSWIKWTYNKIQFCFPSKFHSTCAHKFLPWHLKGEERAVPRSSFGRPRLCLAWCPLVILRACCSYQLVPMDVVPWTSTTWPWQSGWLWLNQENYEDLRKTNKKTPWDSTNFSTKDDRWIPTNPTNPSRISWDLGGIPGDALGVTEITDLTIKADAEWVKKRMDEVWLGSAVYWR